MNPPLLILAALLVDAFLGDPEGWPHPVCLIGRLQRALDGLIDRSRPPAVQRAAGAAVALAVPLLSGLIAALLWFAAWMVHPRLANLTALYLLETAFAGRCLTDEVLFVRRLLAEGELNLARIAVGMLVGRDTRSLSASEVAAAAVETTAENTSDGVIAPLFWAVAGLFIGSLFGHLFQFAAPNPQTLYCCVMVGCMAFTWIYKAANTADSIMGYRTPRHLHVGRCAALLDDALNLIPARLTAFTFCLLGTLTFRFAGWKALLRDGRKHLSPNAGLPEAAAAGVLNLRLGGTHLYFGRPVAKPVLWPEGNDPLPGDIERCCWLAAGTEMIFAVLVMLLRWL